MIRVANEDIFTIFKSMIMKNLIIMVKKYNKYQFSKLNYFLKNSIFNFLPIEQRMNEISKIKKFREVLNKQKYIQRLKRLLKVKRGIETNLLKINNIKKNGVFSSVKIDSKEFLNDLCAYLFKESTKKDDYIYIDSTFITEIDSYFVDLIQDYIKENDIKKFSISDIAIGKCHKNLKKICEALKIKRNITSIEFNNTCLSESTKNMKNICELIKSQKNLVWISLCENNLGKDIMNLKYLLNSVKNNKSLESIYLENNNFELNTMNSKLIVQILKRNKVLDSIDLDDNFSETEAKIFDKFISLNRINL